MAEHQGDHGEHGAYSEVFEEGKDAGQSQTIHRIRANSTIMQLKKLLGEYSSSIAAWRVAELLPVESCVLTMSLGLLQWPTVERSVSYSFPRVCDVTDKEESRN